MAEPFNLFNIPAVDGITDAADIRSVLIQSGRLIHAPLQGLVDTALPFASQAEANAGVIATKAMSPLTTTQVVLANIPIFASLAAARDKVDGILASAKSIQLQFYNPSYAVLNTLVGQGYWSRMSKVAIDAAAYPALAQFRSVDRFMPDGTTDATNGGYWVLNDDEPTPQMLGLVDDSAVLVQTAIFQAWVTLCGILGKPCNAPVPAWIKIDDTINFPTNVDADLKQIRITYSGTKDRTVLDFPSGANRVYTFGIVEGDTPNWDSDDYCGISFGNITDCYVRLQLTRRFTVGYRLAPTGACAYNKIWPGDIGACKYMERVKSLGPNGFVNENQFFGGNYISGSTVNGLGPRYGTHFQFTHGGYNGHNNNIWYKPSYQMGNTAGDVQATPIFFDGAGGLNTFHDLRCEANVGPIAIFSGAAATQNEIGVNFASTWAQQINTIQEVNGAFGNRLIDKYGPDVRAPFNNLHRLLSSAGGANSPYVRGDVFLLAAGSGSALRTTPGANQVRSNALALDLNGAGVFVGVDTTKIKQWRLNAGFIGSLVGSVFAIAFDAAGNRLTGNSLDIDGTAWAPSTVYTTIGQLVTNDTGKIYRLGVAGTSAAAGGPTGTGTAITDGTCVWDFFGAELYIKNPTNGWLANVQYGGGYRHANFAGSGTFSLRPEVATMWIGIVDAAVRSLGLVGYSTAETLDNTSGFTSVIPFVPLDDDGSERLASANPGTAGTHGQYSRGQTVYNSAAASLATPGWTCTTAGWLAAAWAISTVYSIPGRIVINGGNAYRLVTAGTSAGAGGPTGTGTGIVDGTCVWDFAAVQAVFTALPALP